MNRHPYLTGLAVIALVAGWALPAAGRLPVLWPMINGYAATMPQGAPIASAVAGAQVLILGTYLDITGTVYFNGIPAPPALSRSPTEILVTVPAAPSYPFRGPVTVAVGSYAVNGPEFTITAPAPSITSYAPANRSGVPIVSAPPGSPLLILGANLGTSGTVAFNGIPAPPARNWSPTEILVIVPAAPSYPFRGPVTLTVDGQTITGPEFTISQPPPPPGLLRDYTIQPIVKLGDVVGDLEMQVGGPFQVGTLNDNGQLAFIAGNAAGDGVLFQYADGQFTPILFTDPTEGPVSMNQLGTFVVPVRGALVVGNSQQVTTVAVAGMPASAAGTFVDFGPATINDRNEIAFGARFADAGGHEQYGIFFRGQDGQILPVAVQGQALPGLSMTYLVSPPSLDDAGTVAFLGLSCSPNPGCNSGSYIYIWENGTVTLLGLDQQPDGRQVWANNKSRTVLLAAGNGEYLHQLVDGKITPVVESDQEMPGGGNLARLLSTSAANEAGQYAFTAELTDGSTAAYLLNADGKLSLIAKNGMTTDLGVITRIEGANAGTGVALNSKGQVALVVAISGGPETLVLLSPLQP
jgi:IPT/TIG domain-containing protein